MMIRSCRETGSALQVRICFLQDLIIISDTSVVIRSCRKTGSALQSKNCYLQDLIIIPDTFVKNDNQILQEDRVCPAGQNLFPAGSHYHS